MKQKRCARFVVVFMVLAMAMGMCPAYGLAEELCSEDVEPLAKNESLLQDAAVPDDEDQDLVQVQSSGSADSNQTDDDVEVYAAEAATHVHDGITFIEWTDAAALPTTEGSYCLMGDVTLGSTWVVPEGVAINLCLNGHAIKTDASFADTYAIQVSPNGTLDLYDCVGGGLITCSKPGGVNTGVDSEGNATFNMRGGEISGFQIGVGTNLTFVEKGEKSVGTYGKFNMYAGAIKDNGIHGVYVFSGSFNMYDGTISGNGGGDSGSNGAGVYVNYSDFAMTGGVISGNNAYDSGGGLYAFRVGTVQISGGTIEGNTAGKNGGGIVVDKNSITISGGEISGNTASVNGGGIWVGLNPDSSAAEIEAEASSDGGTLNLTGGTIANNTASNLGGGIYVQENSTLKVSGGPKVTGNATSNMYLPALTMTVDGKLTDDASLGVTHVNKDGATDTSAFTTGCKAAGNTVDPATYFTSDDTNYNVVWTEDGNEACLKKVYRIAFDANGGEGSMSEQDVEAGASLTLPTNSFTRSGYVFTGWNTVADGSGTSYADGETITPEKHMTLYAQWGPVAIPEPVMVNSRGGTFTSVSEEVTYTISQELPDYVSSMKIWVDLEPVLYFTTDEDGVVVRTSDGEEVAADVSIDGQRLTVSVADVTSLRGKTVEVLYKAKVRDEADLSPYLNADKTIASVPYQAHTQFDGLDEWTVESKKESVNYRVSSSSGSTTSSSTKASGGTSSSTKSSLAKTSDPVSFVPAILLSVAGAGLAFVGCKRRK